MKVFFDFHLDKTEEARMAGKPFPVRSDLLDFFVDILECNAQEGIQLVKDNSEFLKNCAELVEGNLFILLD